MKHRIGLSIALIVVILLLGANAYIWRVQNGVYEYSVAVYFAGVLTPVGVVCAVMFANRNEGKKG